MAQPFLAIYFNSAHRRRRCGVGYRGCCHGEKIIACRHRRCGVGFSRWKNHAALRPRVLRVGTTLPVIARTANPLILAIPALSWVVAVVETTTQIIQQNKIVRIVFTHHLLCGISRALTDHHLCSQRILCSAHARTRTGVH